MKRKTPRTLYVASMATRNGLVRHTDTNYASLLLRLNQHYGRVRLVPRPWGQTIEHRDTGVAIGQIISR